MATRGEFIRNISLGTIVLIQFLWFYPHFPPCFLEAQPKMGYGEQLSHLCRIYGVEERYWDVNGLEQEASQETKQALLLALGVAAETEEAVNKAIEHYYKASWNELCPPVLVFFEHELPARIPISFSEGQNCRWLLQTETGEEMLEGEVALETLAQLDCMDVYGTQYWRRELKLEVALTPGYYRLGLQTETKGQHVQLIVCPNRCFVS